MRSPRPAGFDHSLSVAAGLKLAGARAENRLNRRSGAEAAETGAATGGPRPGQPVRDFPVRRSWRYTHRSAPESDGFGRALG